MLRALSSKLHNSSALNAAVILVHLTSHCVLAVVWSWRDMNIFLQALTPRWSFTVLSSPPYSPPLPPPANPPNLQVKKALTHKQTPNAHTAKERSVRIKYKCLVPIYGFPKMKLWGLVISKTELYVMFCLPISTFMYL